MAALSYHFSCSDELSDLKQSRYGENLSPKDDQTDFWSLSPSGSLLQM